jgi:hypothetical protein
LLEKYGTPNATEQDLTVIDLPYPMNWASSTKVKKISCHKLVADKLVIFKEILAVYGIENKSFAA